MIPFRDHLLQAYGGFADRRHKDPAKDHLIRVHDHKPTDVYAGFCSIFVSVPDRDGNSLILTLNNAPCDEAIEALVTRHGGTVRSSRLAPTITLPLKLNQVTLIRQLAKAIRQRVNPGRRYADPNWWWICRRTAKSLKRLARSLKAYNALRACERRSQARPPRNQSPRPSPPRPDQRPRLPSPGNPGCPHPWEFPAPADA